MVASSFGSVASSLWRTSANERSDEILMCSTEMVCEVAAAFMVALFILLWCVLSKDEVVIFGRYVAGEARVHQLHVAGFTVGKITEAPAAGRGIFRRILHHELYVHARAGNERLNPSAGKTFGQNFVIILRSCFIPMQRGN